LTSGLDFYPRDGTTYVTVYDLKWVFHEFKTFQVKYLGNWFRYSIIRL